MKSAQDYELTEQIISKLVNTSISKSQRFSCMYQGFYTDLPGNTPKEAIMFFIRHYNSIISFLYDNDENEIYKTELNKQKDKRGRNTFRYVSIETGETIFDELESNLDKPPKQVTLTNEHFNGFIDVQGNFYACIYGGHKVLAEKLCAHGIVRLVDKDPEKSIELASYIKISDSNIRFFSKYRMSENQVSTLLKFFELQNLKTVEFNLNIISVSRFLELA